MSNILVYMIATTIIICGCKNKTVTHKDNVIDTQFLNESFLRNDEGGILSMKYKSYYIYKFYVDYFPDHINNEYVLTIKELDSVAIISQKTLFHKIRVGYGLSPFVDSAIYETSKIIPASDILLFKKEIANIIDDSLNYSPPQELSTVMSSLVFSNGKQISLFSLKNLGYKKMNRIDSIFLFSGNLQVLDSNIVDAATHYRQLFR